MWSYRRKGSRFDAACCLLLGTVGGTMYAASAVQLLSLGYAIASVGWFGFGLSQGYRSLYDSRLGNIDDSIRRRIEISRYAMLVCFALITVGLAIRWAR